MAVSVGVSSQTLGTMSSGHYFYVFPHRGVGVAGKRSVECGMCRVRPDNGVNILSGTPCTAWHALSALIDSKNVIRSKFHLTFDTTRSPHGPCPSLVLSTVKPVCKMSVRSKRIRTHPSTPGQSSPYVRSIRGRWAELKAFHL